MRNLSRILVAVAVGALALPALAGAAPTPKAHGIVVQRDAKAGVVVVANKSGKLQRIHVAKPNALAMGTILQVTGTRVSVVGHARTAKLRGVVVRRHRHSFALAGNGSVLAVTSPTPPPAGEQVTATVQVTPTALNDDDGQVQVDSNQVASAEIRGTFVSLVGTTLTLAVPGFPANLTIATGGVSVPTGLAVGTPLDARVALAPIANNPAGVTLTLLSLSLDNNQNGDQNGNGAEVDGTVISVMDAGPTTAGSITIDDGDNGPITFIIPAGFAPTGVTKGDEVEAWGTPATTSGGQPTLTKLEIKGSNSGSGGGHDHSSDGGNPAGSGGNPGGND